MQVPGDAEGYLPTHFWPPSPGVLFLSLAESDCKWPHTETKFQFLSKPSWLQSWMWVFTGDQDPCPISALQPHSDPGELQEHKVLMEISGIGTLRGQQVQRSKTLGCGKNISKATGLNGLSTYWSTPATFYTPQKPFICSLPHAALQHPQIGPQDVAGCTGSAWPYGGAEGQTASSKPTDGHFWMNF